MSSRPCQVLLTCLALSWAFSCSVFPDQAKLPTSPGGSASGGEPALPQAGQSEGGQAEGGAHASGGASPAGAGGVESSSGAGPEPLGGAGGQSSCPTALERSLMLGADTWIESAKPAAGHGNQATLSLVAGPDECRVVLSFDLPAVRPGAVLLKATLSLHLESNADVTLAPRQLAVHQLLQPVSETRTTWNNFANGSSGKWAKPGGDFGPELASASLPAESSTGTVAFDLTAAVAAAFSPDASTMPLLVLELGQAPEALAELAFTAAEGDASQGPALVIQYCP